MGLLDVGIFLVSFAVLLVELLLTRIFSVTLYYHVSFMVVSLAMLGFGASGLVVTLARERFSPDRLLPDVARAAIAFALTAVAAAGISFVLPISLQLTWWNWARMSAVYLAGGLAFFCGGLVVSLILSARSAQANRYYFFDLAGAAVGCVAFIPATNLFGAPSAILLAAVAAAGAGWLLARGRDRRVATAGMMVACGLALAFVINGRLPFFNAVFVKGSLQQPTLALRWNSFSRVDVVGTPRSLWVPHPPVFAGFSARLDPSFEIPEVKLQYDANASSQITYFDGDLRRLEYLRFDVSSSAYQLRRYREVLIIGPGGGRDILMALARKSGPVTGVEINPLTVELMRHRFRTFSGGLYQDYPGVTIVNEEARSFLRRQTRRFELIEASVVDTWAASAAGAYALTENGLYTVEAFADYFDHLTPDGVVAFNRWFSDPPFDSLRLANVARQALVQRGVKDPAAHIIAIRTDPADTLLPSLGSILVKVSPFLPSEIATLARYAAEMGFVPVHLPGTGAATPRDAASQKQSEPQSAQQSEEQRDFRELLGPDPAGLIARYPYDISAVFDDRPFFFDRTPVVSWLASRLHLPRSPHAVGRLGLGGQTLLISLAASGVGTILLLVLPGLVRRRRETTRRAPARADLAGGASRRPRRVLWAAYFMGLGAGFILIEMVLIQRLSLFLGYPAYALSVALFTILLASAVGSLWSGTLPPARLLPPAIGALIALLLLCAALLPGALSAARGLPISLRIVIAVAMIAPLGLLMGVPFASGVRAAGAENQELVAWGWAINGGASVLGSGLAVLISMTWGFSVTFLVGAAAYSVAFAAIVPLSRRAATGGAAA